MDINTNINRLKYFQTVCKYNSITKAADELNIAQPSVSIAIQELEHELGITLFLRKNNKLFLTEEGSIVLLKVNNLLSTIDTFFKEVIDISDYINTKVRLGVPPIMGTLISPVIYSEIAKKYPYINLEISESTFQQALNQLEDNHIDIAINLVHDIGDSIPKNYDNEIIYETNIMFFISKNHPFANKKMIKREDLKDISLTLLTVGSSHHKILTQLFNKLNIKPNISLQSLELQTITYFIENFGMGTFTYKEIYKNNPGIVAIPFEIPMNVKICVLWKKNKYISRAEKEIIKFLISNNWDLYI